MKTPRRAAWIVFVVALLVILALGFYRAARHKDPRPDPASAAPASTAAPRS
ncbi:hypothetical protein [Dyella jiangningensis]|uniref:hypothetical protein n=1 Tax=Dyella jiangningensis TaxID=1379159 RepID=UPI001559EA47|nr:hypothetical protein [Dyella jiangningensis]